MFTHRSVEHHDLPQHLSDVRQRVRRQTETTGVHELSDKLLAMLLHGLTNQLLPHLKVFLMLQRDVSQVYRENNCPSVKTILFLHQVIQ